MDPVLAVLQETQLQRAHIDNVCELFDAVEAKDVYTAFEILCKLQKYLGETQSWSFKLLSTHDFDSPGNKFELNLAVMVGDRAQKLLTQIQRWDLRALKRKVQHLPRLSDWAMILTSLVLRISNVSQTVEFNLRIALSRATLVRIHCELSLEVDADDSSPLVHKYRSFVKELLQELEAATNPQDSEKIFKTVADIKHMFRSYKDGQPSQDTRDADESDTPSLASAGAASVASSSGSSAGTSISTTSGILNPNVLGAFESAKNQHNLTSLLCKEPIPEAPQVHPMKKFSDLPFKGVVVHPVSNVSKMPAANGKSNIATTSFMRAMRTGKWT